MVTKATTIKRTTLSLVAVAVLASVGSAKLHATETNNYSIAVELARTAKVNALIDKINALDGYIEKYVLETGDITPTKDEINAYFDLTNKAWENYNGGQINISFDGKKITLSNLFSKTPSDLVQKVFINSDKLPPLATVTSTATTISIPISTQLLTFYNTTNKLINNKGITISSVEPKDTSKLWYQPNGKGGYDIYKYNSGTGKWDLLGSSSNGGSGNGSLGGNAIVVSSLDELKNIPATRGMIAMVSDGKKAIKYVYDGKNWVKASMVSEGGGNADIVGDQTKEDIHAGANTLVEMATTLFDKPNGTTMDILAPDGEWAGKMSFVKKGNYWISVDKSFIIAKDIKTLHNIKSEVPEDAIAWIPKDDNSMYKLQKKKIEDIGGNYWAYVTDNYATLLDFSKQNPPKFDSDGLYYYVTKYKKFFEKTDKYFKSTDKKVFVSNDVSGRDAFGNMVLEATNALFLSQFNDCHDISNGNITCHGTADEGYYTGQKIDGLYSYYYTIDKINKNHLTDKKIGAITSWDDLWDLNKIKNIPEEVTYIGPSKGEVVSGVTLKRKRTPQGFMYYELDGKMINYKDGLSVPYNQLPEGYKYKPSNVKIDYYNGKTWVRCDKLDDFVLDHRLHIGYRVHFVSTDVNGNKVDYYLTKARGKKKWRPYNGASYRYYYYNYWSDNTNDPKNSAKIFITDDEEDEAIVPLVSLENNSRINLVRKLQDHLDGVYKEKRSDIDPRYYRVFFTPYHDYFVNDIMSNYSAAAIPVFQKNNKRMTYSTTYIDDNNNIIWKSGVTTNIYANKDDSFPPYIYFNKTFVGKGIVNVYPLVFDGCSSDYNNYSDIAKCRKTYTFGKNNYVFSGDLKTRIYGEYISHVTDNGLLVSKFNLIKYNLNDYYSNFSNIYNKDYTYETAKNACENLGMYLPTKEMVKDLFTCHTFVSEYETKETCNPDIQYFNGDTRTIWLKGMYKNPKGKLGHLTVSRKWNRSYQEFIYNYKVETDNNAKSAFICVR